MAHYIDGSTINSIIYNEINCTYYQLRHTFGILALVNNGGIFSILYSILDAPVNFLTGRNSFYNKIVFVLVASLAHGSASEEDHDVAEYKFLYYSKAKVLKF